MTDLVLCALHRAGKPCTAGTLADVVNGLAMAEGWPPSLCRHNPRQIAHVLRALAIEGKVRTNGSEKDRGNDRPLWEPQGKFNNKHPIPDPPAQITAKNANPVDQMNRTQLLALFSIQDAALIEYAAQREERAALDQAHDKRLRALTERAKIQLAAAGLGE